MSRRVLVLVESNTTGTGREFARSARQLGVHPILMAVDPSRYPYASEDGLEVMTLDTQSHDTMLDACRGISARDSLVGITTSSDYFVYTAAVLARTLGLPGPAPEAIKACQHKGTMRDALAVHGVPIPGYHAVTSVDDAVAAARALEFPTVVKPAAGSGSLGVLLCSDEETIARHARTLLDRRHNERGIPVPACILVEQFITGPEYSVEVFNRTVLGITAKHLSELPLFVEIGHDYPADVDSEVAMALQRVTLAALDALGLVWGPAHVELRVGANGPVLIEVNARLAGGMIPNLMRATSGVDVVERVVCMAMNKMPTEPEPGAGAASIRFVLPPRAGLLTGAEGLEQARAAHGVTEVMLRAKVGESLLLQGDFRDRIGHVIATGASTEQARDNVTAAMRMIRIHVTDASDGHNS